MDEKLEQLEKRYEELQTKVADPNIVSDMAKYRIAWMPGDGIGVDVMDGARLVLDAMKFDAEYVPADIGREFWCSRKCLRGRDLPVFPVGFQCSFGAAILIPSDRLSP